MCQIINRLSKAKLGKEQSMQSRWIFHQVQKSWWKQILAYNELDGPKIKVGHLWREAAPLTWRVTVWILWVGHRGTDSPSLFCHLWARDPLIPRKKQKGRESWISWTYYVPAANCVRSSLQCPQAVRSLFFFFFFFFFCFFFSFVFFSFFFFFFSVQLMSF
jgi:hypothetical protein